MAKIERYIPTIGNPDWNIKELSKEERTNLKERLVISLIDNEEDYQRVIAYMYKKFPYEMDGVKAPDTGKTDTAIQWNYSPAKNKLMVYNSKTKKYQDMYAFVVYDKERNYEPVAFAGSYFKICKEVDSFKNNDINYKYTCDSYGDLAEFGQYQRVGHGYVLFVDPNYRRLGLGTDLWWAEAQLYREALNIRIQREIQNSYSIESTKKMFSDPSKCIITSEGRLKNDGTRAQIRCLLDYEDEDVIEGFKSMVPNLKTIYNLPHWNFLEREEITNKDLLKYWEK